VRGHFAKCCDERQQDPESSQTLHMSMAQASDKNFA
jgi:hypothetical protein